MTDEKWKQEIIKEVEKISGSRRDIQIMKALNLAEEYFKKQSPFKIRISADDFEDDEKDEEISRLKIDNIDLCKKLEILKRVIERLKKTSINLYSFKENEKGVKQGIIDKVWVNIEEGESDLCMLMLNLFEEHLRSTWKEMEGKGFCGSCSCCYSSEREISRLKQEMDIHIDDFSDGYGQGKAYIKKAILEKIEGMIHETIGYIDGCDAAEINHSGWDERLKILEEVLEELKCEVKTS